MVCSKNVAYFAAGDLFCEKRRQKFGPRGVVWGTIGELKHLPFRSWSLGRARGISRNEREKSAVFEPLWRFCALRLVSSLGMKQKSLQQHVRMHAVPTRLDHEIFCTGIVFDEISRSRRTEIYVGHLPVGRAQMVNSKICWNFEDLKKSSGESSSNEFSTRV